MDHEQTGEPWYPIPPDQDEQENPDPPEDLPCYCGDQNCERCGHA